MTRPLTFALPKGRVLATAGPLLEQAGWDGWGSDGEGASLEEALGDKSRALIRSLRFRQTRVDVLLLKPDDVPTYVEFGAADMGICGRDILDEREADVYQPVDLGIGRCRLVVAGRVGLAPPSGRLARVATKYPRLAARHFARRGAQVDVVNVQGSVELAPLTGLSDWIVDLVETGQTLAQNGLEVKEEVSRVSSLLILNRASYKLRVDLIRPMVEAFRDVRR